MTLQSAGVAGNRELTTGAAIPRRAAWWRFDTMAAALVVCAAMLWLAAHGSHAPVTDCGVPPVVLAFGSETTISAATTAGRPCTVPVRVASAAIEAFSISEPAAHGMLVPRGRTGVVYLPGRGFRGTDAFAFQLSGRSTRAAGTMTVRVAVTVR